MRKSPKPALVEVVGSALAVARAGEDTPVLAGVSGGLDSVVLLHLLVSAEVPVIVAHLNHGLRGAESDADEMFTVAMAKSLGCECLTERVNVGAVAETNRLSIETAGRESRRGFFARCAALTGARVLVLAHHADDQAETVLWNLARGCGLRGAAGMAADEWQTMDGYTPLRVARPLLGIRREALAGYALAGGLDWRDDASNAGHGFTRNRIRHQVMPVLDEATGRDTADALARFAAIAREEDAVLEKMADAAAAALTRADGKLELRAFRGLERALQRRVALRWLAGHGIGGVGFREIEGMLEVACGNGKPASMNLPGGARLRRRSGLVFLDYKL